jgi:hypothetical protein
VLGSNILLAALISLHAATPAPAAGQTVYRIELSGNQTIWSEDQPRDSGALLLFHRYPGGLLVSVKKADVRRVTLSSRTTVAGRGLRPGNVIELGRTGSGSTATPGGAEAATPGGTAADGTPLPLGERKDGTALLNPDRPYRPDWDTKQVPGLNLAYPASPNDYREGKTMAYPPAAAVQEAPGEPPKMPPNSGEPPKGPSN